MGKLQIRRGNQADLPTFDSGEPGIATDSLRAYIGSPSGNKEIQLKAASSDYTLYVATSTYGGASTGTGKAITSSTTTGTAVNKLIDSTANFTSATHLNKTVYNATDATWAKVTAVDSATQLSLSADIMVSGKSYVVSNALDSIPTAFSLVDTPYLSNVTIRVSPGTFSNNINLIGKNAGDDKTFTIQGSTTGTTTISGTVTVRQKVTLANLTFSNWIKAYFGADITWNTCVTSGTSKLYHYEGNANAFTSCTITFANDPGAYTNVGSTITKGYTLYVATSTYGGSDSTGDGLAMYSGTVTSTTANKLVDSAANFGTDVVGKTVYNTVDNTWAKVSARDSATQLSLTVDIMASGEGYVISNPFATIQKAVDTIPGSVNCDTTVQVSGENHTESVNVWGKNFSGTYSITLQGSRATADTGTATSGANLTGAGSAGFGTLTDTSKSWTTNTHQNKFVEITGGTGAGQTRPIHSNTANALTIVGRWDTVPNGTSTYRIFTLATVDNGSGFAHCVKVDNGQKGINLKYLKLTNAGNDNFKGNVLVFNGSSCNLYWCHLESGNYWNIQCATGATGYSEGCVFRNAAIGDIRVDYGASWTGVKQCRLTGWQNRSLDASSGGQMFNNYQSYIGGGVGAGSVAIYAAMGGGFYTDAYFEVDGSPSHNIVIQDNGVVFVNGIYGARSTQVIKNAGGWGIYAVGGGISHWATSVTFSGNTSGTYTPTSATAGGNN